MNADQSKDSKMRLAKSMAHRGYCSRREADSYILKGWVKVNNQIILQKGFPVSEEDKIELSQEAKISQNERVTILINKPVGYVSAQPEKGYQAAVSLITNGNHWKSDTSGRRFTKGHLAGLAPAGRLDIDSKGLLVLTSDGRIARRLIGENSDKEKEYLVRVQGQIKENGLSLLQYGLELDEQKLKPAKVHWQNKDQLRFILKQGRKRQIRRMCDLVGLEVIGLKRIRIGAVLLGSLPEGQWRYLGKNEDF